MLTQVPSGMLQTTAQYYGFKNRIINGAMLINQYNSNTSVAIASDGQYFMDRYQGKATQASKYNAQMVTPSTSGYVTAPAGFSNYIALTVSSAYTVTSSDYFYINQRIEGYNIVDWNFGYSTAKTITISFWVYSNITGTFGGCLQNIDASRTYPFTYSISSANTWTFITLTISGDTTGGWNTNNGIGLVVCLSLGAGSTYSGTPGAWTSAGSYRSATGAVSIMGSTSNYLYTTGLQLEAGAQATSFDYRPYGTELALCQRYCLVDSNFGTNFAHYAGGGAGATTSIGFDRQFPVQMRTAPSITPSSQTAFLVDGAGVAPATLTVTDQGISTPLIGRIGATVSSGLTVGGYYALAANSSGTVKTITYSAEL